MIMNATDWNTALYEKMSDEQDKFRDWLKSQPPEEILHHTYEYTVREDIVMAMEQLELTDAQFREMLEFIRRTRQEGRIEVSYACEGFLGGYEAEVRDHFYQCAAGVSVASIRVDGAISGCTSIRANYHQGNIYRDRFWDVWQNRFEPFRDREWARRGECADCSMFRYCQGGGMHLRGDDGELLYCHYRRL